MKPQQVVFMEVFWGTRGEIADWCKDELSVEAQAEFDALLIELAAMPRSTWSMPDFKPLGDGIFELRFKVSGKQYRPLGYDGPGPRQFTLLIGAYKKMKKWTPQDATKTAKKRRKEIKDGIRKVRLYAEHLFKDVSEVQG
jgi:putative component of toxin-antitoxin plasmid stabilization module